MDKIPLPLGCVTSYIVRHGERIDHIDDSWVHSAAVPYDPPLTDTGQRQAYLTGQLIHNIEQQQAQPTPDNTEYLVLTSPFLRCAQTAQAIHQGFVDQSARTHSAQTRQWKIAVEPGLSEVMNESYFEGPLPESLVGQRADELAAHDVMQYDFEYEPSRSGLPEYPEHFQDMMARFVGTLDYATGVQLGRMSAQAMRGDGSSAALGMRRVLVLVTHGAGIKSLLWATTRQPDNSVASYCCLTRAQVLARLSSLPLAPPGSSRMPAFLWSVDYRAYSQHITPNL
ncbi:hypothetical protein H4S02_008698 [Coemansia sp. RSA 2611]|nr:hypothetical protein H4S02_008698 [Coemansia sp. RSA 2611]